MDIKWKFYGGIALLLLTVVFTLQNTEIVTINFLFWKLSISRALMIFILLIIGILIGWTGASLSKHSKRYPTQTN